MLTNPTQNQQKILEIVKADIISLGGRMRGSNTPMDISFTNHAIPMQKGMCIYLFSDGYMDQFNIKQKLRFGSKQFKQLLTKSAELLVKEQKDMLKNTLDNWLESGKQIDDVLVMGIKM